ncbi:MAG: hypothetical protein ACFB21_15685 [Opitutales bacterium]
MNSPSARTTYRLTDYPDWLPEPEVEPLVRELTAKIREGELSPKKPDLARQWFAQTAATRAAKGGRGGAEEDPELLIDSLLRCEQPLSDPRGRPTLVEWSERDLAKRFGLA